VSEAGSLTGRVGDLGRGFLKAVCGGDSCILVFGAELCVAAVDGLLIGFEAWLGPVDAFPALCSCVLGGASFAVFLTGVVGVFGTAGDFKLFFGDVLDTADVLAVDIEAGLFVTLPAGFSTGFVEVELEDPFVMADFSPSLLGVALGVSGFLAVPFAVSIFVSVG
jgi:hypothetical protein